MENSFLPTSRLNIFKQWVLDMFKKQKIVDSPDIRPVETTGGTSLFIKNPSVNAPKPNPPVWI